MTAPTTVPQPVTMSHPDRWMAVLRILFGFWFAKALFSKMDLVLLGGFFPFLGVEDRWIELMPKIVARQAAENPILWYKAFLETTVIPNGALFAQLTAWGETLVGLSLVLGLFAGVGSLGALWLSLIYGLASAHTSPASEGFHYLLVVVSVVLFLSRSGKSWGLDGWIAWRWPGTPLSWRPLA
jgi:uncharacterized membrane protein YphA (DoxX/SURF4 family)